MNLLVDIGLKIKYYIYILKQKTFYCIGYKCSANYDVNSKMSQDIQFVLISDSTHVSLFLMGPTNNTDQQVINPK